MSSDAIVWIAVGSCATAIIAMFNLYLLFLKPWWGKPRFSLEFHMTSPFCANAICNFGDGDKPALWLRIRVKNSGRSIAKSCLVKLARIIDSQGNSVEPFDPTSLHWVATQWKAVPFGTRDLNIKEPEYVDVLVTQLDAHNICICGDQFVWAEYEERAILSFLNPGSYVFQITAYGENIEPKTKFLSLTWDGKDFRKNLSLKLHRSLSDARRRISGRSESSDTTQQQIRESNGIRSKAGVQAGLAVALCGSLPFLRGGPQIAAIVVISILFISALLLCFRNKFTGNLWKRIVNIAGGIDVGYTAVAFGMSGAGISLLGASWWQLGIALLLIGASILGIGIGKNILKGVNARSRGQ